MNLRRCQKERINKSSREGIEEWIYCERMWNIAKGVIILVKIYWAEK